MCRISHFYANQNKLRLTPALWFQVAVDRRWHGLHLRSSASVHGVPPERRGEGADGSQWGATKTHMGRWWDLSSKGCQVTCGRGGMNGKGWGERGHGDVVGILGGVRGGMWRHPGTREEVVSNWGSVF